MAKTAAFFLGLEDPTKKSSTIDVYRGYYDFRAAGTQCLARLFKTAPLQHVKFTNIERSVKQCILLATRPHPVRLTFTD